MDVMNHEYVKSLGTNGVADTAAHAEVEAKANVETVVAGMPSCASSVYEALTTEDQGAVVAICAEPGMGRTTLLVRALEERVARGERTRYEDAKSWVVDDAEQQLAEMASWCRKESRFGRRVCVAVDNMPSTDESEAARLTRMIRKIAASGATFLFCVLPEGELLVEQCTEARCYWSCDLRVMRQANHDCSSDDATLARGVPRLVAAISRLSDCSIEVAMADPGYQQALTQVVWEALRDGIMGEERRLRLALMLCGSGALEDVDRVLGGVDPDLLRLLARDAPFFGINVMHGTFSCAGVALESGIAPVSPQLAQHVAEWPDIVPAVIELLVSRGDCVRAAHVCGVCAELPEYSRLVLRWSVEFINIGAVDVVSEVLEDSSGVRGDEPGFAEASLMLSALSKPWVGADITMPTALPTQLTVVANLAVACRAQLAGVAGQDGIMGGADLLGEVSATSVIEDLVAHYRAFGLLVSGRLDEAYALLLDRPERLRRVTVSSALLEMDYVFCSLLMGIVPTKDDFAALDEGYELLSGAGLKDLAGIHETLLPLTTLLAGRKPGYVTFEANVNRASRMGNSVLQGIYLLGSAVLDVRGHVLLRAHVRLKQALTLFASSASTFLHRAAHLLDVCVRICLLERVSRSEIASCRGGGTSLDRLVTTVLAATATKRSGRQVGAGRWESDPNPRNVYWLLNVLMTDFGELSQQIREILPTTWRESVDRSVAEIDSFAESTRATTPEDTKLLKTPNEIDLLTPSAALVDASLSRRVRIFVLGGLEVWVDGTSISVGALERRRAKGMLALLACVPGHVAKRFTLMESIWPEYDYETAHRCVYSATSVLRGEICSVLSDVDGKDVVASNRSDRTVLLKMDMVSCDVDAFESRVRRVLDGSTKSETVVELCREIEELYRGELFVPATDGAGVMASRRRELHGLFADAMVAGARAAMEVGSKTLACRFAKKAHDSDPMREDAIQTLVSALCEAGRHVEAERVYEEYVSHVVDVMRRPPSRALRAAAGELLRGQSKEAPVVHKLQRREAEVYELPRQSGPEQLCLDLGKALAS